jgi:hypothetical protein
VAFNDYWLASNKGDKLEGRLCDNEGSFKIDPEKNLVTCYMNGNIAPYVHRIIQTSETSGWQYFMDIKDKKIVVIFEEIDRLLNHDVPYRLCRVYAYKLEELQKLGNYKDDTLEECCYIPIIKNFYADIIQTVKVEEKKYLFEKYIEEDPALELEVVKDIKMTKKEEDILDFCMKNRPGAFSKEEMLNFTKHKEEIRSMYQSWDVLANLFKKNDNERIMTRLENDVRYVTLELMVPGLLGLTYKRQTVTAKMVHVLEAYLRIGQKQQSMSIEQCIDHCQRDMAAKLNVGVFDLHEAFLIAKVIKSQQALRTQKILSMSSSASQFYKK